MFWPYCTFTKARLSDLTLTGALDFEAKIPCHWNHESSMCVLLSKTHYKIVDFFPFLSLAGLYSENMCKNFHDFLFFFNLLWLVFHNISSNILKYDPTLFSLFCWNMIITILSQNLLFWYFWLIIFKNSILVNKEWEACQILVWIRPRTAYF